MDILIQLLILVGLAVSGMAADNQQASASPYPVGDSVQLTGTVVGTIDDCIFDGICALVVETEDDDRVEVIWATGMIPCEGQYTGDVVVGDTVEFFAEVTAAQPFQVSICSGSDYYIRAGQ